MQHTMRVLDRSGDTLLAEWDDTDADSVEKASARYSEMLASGRLGFATKGDNRRDVRLLDRFRSDVDIIGVTPAVGG